MAFLNLSNFLKNSSVKSYMVEFSELSLSENLHRFSCILKDKD